MKFEPKSICIHGVGLLGGSIGAALKASGYQGCVIGVSSPATVESARALGIIDEGFGYGELRGCWPDRLSVPLHAHHRHHENVGRTWRAALAPGTAYFGRGQYEKSN